jgi:2-aminoadipate transaminase
MLRFSQNAKNMRSSEIRELLSIAVRPDMISFAGGMPNNDLFPVEEVDEIYGHLSKAEKQVGFQYGPTPGHPPLLESLSHFLKSKSLPVEQNRLMITSGSLQAINLLTKVFIDPGDKVITEDPCFIGAITAFKSYQAHFCCVKMDEDGMVLEQLEKTLEQNPDARMLYLTLNFHNPAGLIYSRERREGILERLHHRSLVLIEDDAYSDLYFADADLEKTRPLKTMGKEPVPICYVGSFSKIFGPGMRLGWILAPETIVKQCELAKQSMDACSSTFTQMLAHEFLSQNKLADYLPKIRLAYQRRCHIMLEALQQHMPDTVSWNRPIGGFYIWVKLPAGVDATAVLQKSLSEGAVFVVGKTFDPHSHRNDHIRLAFCHTPEDKITDGIRIVSQAVRSFV